MTEFGEMGGVLFRYSGDGGEVTIPYGIVRIANEVFKDNTSIREVTLPYTIREIGSEAFSGCTNLRRINIPSSVNVIGYRVFAGCTSLEGIILPDKIVKIQSETFRGCTSLRYARISDSVEHIGLSAFEGCTSLERVTLPEKAEVYRNAFRGCDKLVDENGLITVGKKVVYYAGGRENLVIPDGIEELDFLVGEEDEMLCSVYIPDSVVDINNSFYNCVNLVSVRLPGNLKRIMYYSFHGCKKLRDFCLPKDAGEDELEQLWTCTENACIQRLVANYLLMNFMHIVSKTPLWKNRIKEYKKQVIESALEDNNVRLIDALFSLYRRIGINELDELIKRAESSVEIKAFLLRYRMEHYTADELDDIEALKTDKELGFAERTIADWRRIYNFRYVDNEVVITKYLGEDTHIVLPDTIGPRRVTGIGKRAFKDRKTLVRITLPESITSIGESAFEGCNSLTSITLPSGVKRIGSLAFCNCNGLDGIAIPEGVELLEASVFDGCTSLTGVQLPETLWGIGRMAFHGCSSLEEIKLPDGLTSLGYGVFEQCRSLKKINIPAGVATIRGCLFEQCTALESVFIPEGPTDIEFRAFAWCSSLIRIDIPASVNAIDENAFMGCDNVVLLAPRGSFTERFARINGIKCLPQ